MTWHLKDRELEKKLIAIDPDFIEKLNQNCELWDPNHDGDFFEFKHFTQKLIYKLKLLGDLVFSGNELEYIPEYNPHTWNDSRKVNPPNDVVFRAEIHEISISGHKWVNYQCLIYKDNKWFFFRDGREAERVFLEDVEYIMYRPWED